MAHKSYEESIKGVYKGLFLLAAVTLVEVFISLFGKGHLGFDPSGMTWVLGIVGIGLVVLSLYKAYYIIYEFMHLGSEVRGLRLSILLPCILLVWAIIAFFQEGNSWYENREKIRIKNDRTIQEQEMDLQGSIIKQEDTYVF